MNALLEVRNVRKRFDRGGPAALRGVSFDLREGELLTLVGASGSGKTTLLRIIAGLEAADEGEVLLAGEPITMDGAILVPPELRQMGFVFQNHALFPHLRVRENVGFGLGRGNHRDRISALLALVGLDETASRYPHELSGGERQRIALVRALAREPRLLLMDEPFSSLDQALRVELRDETCRLIREQQASTILVTHDTVDALAVSDRIAIMHTGEIQQVGSPAEIYRQPVNRYVAASFGPCNFLDRSLAANPAALDAIAGIEPRAFTDEEIWIRPEDLALSTEGAGNSIASGTVSQSLFHGESRVVTLICNSPGGAPFTVQVREHGNRSAATGDKLHVIPAGH